MHPHEIVAERHGEFSIQSARLRPAGRVPLFVVSISDVQLKPFLAQYSKVTRSSMQKLNVAFEREQQRFSLLSFRGVELDANIGQLKEIVTNRLKDFQCLPSNFLLFKDLLLLPCMPQAKLVDINEWSEAQFAASKKKAAKVEEGAELSNLFADGAVKGHVQLLCFKPDYVDEQAGPIKDHLTTQELQESLSKIISSQQELFEAQLSAQQEQLKAQLSAQQEQLTHFFEIFNYLLMDRFKFSSGDMEREDNHAFKAKLYNYYAQPKPEADTYPEHLRCALAGIDLPATSIIAARLWKYEWKDSIKVLFNFSDINDPRNGLLLYKIFKEAYDRAQICFVYHADEAVATWRCHVLDKNILLMTWKQYVKAHENASSEGKIGEGVTRVMDALEKKGLSCFQDIDGRALCLSPLQQPFKRVLGMHARFSLIRAGQEERLPRPDWDFEDFATDGLYTFKKCLANWASVVGSNLPSGEM